MDKDEDENLYSLKELEELSHDDELIIFGGCDLDPQCTFINGYVKRQAIYSCQTCTIPSREPAGICYHCSVTCHDGHDIIEIYTKRNFRCDCGNKKFKNMNTCMLWEEKDDINELNKYNQNFAGNYCVCSKPYPEHENDNREMFQCIVCEDWYHLEHVSLTPQTTIMDTDEFTCSLCLKKHPFLFTYIFASDPRDIKGPEAKVLKIECKLEQVLSDLDINPNEIDWNSIDYKKLFDLEDRDISGKFWPQDWRQSILCHCKRCLQMYKSFNLEFLTDIEDTLQFYSDIAEQIIKKRNEEDEQDFNEALNTLPRPVAIDIVSGINDFKNALTSLIRDKENSGDNIIREEDVRKAFNNLLKKRLNENS